MHAIALLDKIQPGEKSSTDISVYAKLFRDAMDDDFNSPVLIAHLFDAVKLINNLKEGRETLSKADLETLKTLLREYIFDVLGLQNALSQSEENEALKKVMELIIQLRSEARSRKDFATSDQIRDSLLQAGIQLKDTRNGVEWEL